jgi:hypothetical protein
MAFMRRVSRLIFRISINISKMRGSIYFVFSALLLLFFSQQPLGVLGGCNVRSVSVATADAQSQAVQAITSAFAACTKCPCNVKVTSEAKIVAQVRQNKKAAGNRRLPPASVC